MALSCIGCASPTIWAQKLTSCITKQESGLEAVRTWAVEDTRSLTGSKLPALAEWAVALHEATAKLRSESVEWLWAELTTPKVRITWIADSWVKLAWKASWWWLIDDNGVWELNVGETETSW